MDPLLATDGTFMFDELLPKSADNNYRGRKIALWFFVLLVLLNMAMSLNCILNGYFVAASADGVPLDTLRPAGAQAVISLFAT